MKIARLGTPIHQTGSSMADITARWRHFDLCSAREWHAILALRARVFVVEQNCPYLDPDLKDPRCFHLELCGDGLLVGTLRAVPPGVSYAESSLGRVAVDLDYRGRQLGRELMLRGIAFNREMWGGAIRISGQAYLERFYASLGFATVSEPYDEDGIPHLEMLLPE